VGTTQGGHKIDGVSRPTRHPAVNGGKIPRSVTENSPAAFVRGRQIDADLGRETDIIGGEQNDSLEAMVLS